jgi:hypothetical protein
MDDKMKNIDQILLKSIQNIQVAKKKTGQQKSKKRKIIFMALNSKNIFAMLLTVNLAKSYFCLIFSIN